VNILATSDQYAVLADQDYVYLKTRGEQHRLGCMYGNAQGAYIDPQERWAVIIGCGLWVVRLPFAARTKKGSMPSLATREVLAGAAFPYVTSPLVELMVSPEDIMWLETVYFTGQSPDTVRVVADLTDTYAGVYDLDLRTLRLTKRL
jgi:hypothetical protein